jgi:hypothetical protein
MGYVAKSEKEQVQEVMFKIIERNKVKTNHQECNCTPDGKKFALTFASAEPGRIKLHLHNISFELLLTVKDIEVTIQRQIDWWLSGREVIDTDRDITYQVVKERFQDACPERNKNPFAKDMPAFVSYFFTNFDKYGEIFGAVMRAYRYVSTTSTMRVLNGKGTLQTYFGVPRDILSSDAANIDEYIAQMGGNLVFVEGFCKIFGITTANAMPAVDGVKPTPFMQRFMRMTGLDIWDLAYVCKFNELHKLTNGAMPFLYIAPAPNEHDNYTNTNYIKQQLNEFVKLESARVSATVAEKATAVVEEQEEAKTLLDSFKAAEREFLKEEMKAEAVEQVEPPVPVDLKEVDLTDLRASLMSLK